MIENQLIDLKQIHLPATGSAEIEGDLISILKFKLALQLEKHGYSASSGESISDFFSDKLKTSSGEQETELTSDLSSIADLIADIHLELRGNNSKPDDVATRAGVPQQEIAQTLHDIAHYIRGQNIGSAHNQLAEKWLEPGNLPDQIEQADQERLRLIFGKGDPRYYHVGKIGQDLLDARKLLEFLAYRELLDSSTSLAQDLVARIDAFKGSIGGHPYNITDRGRERMSYISKIERHASEVYIAPKEPVVFRSNIANFAYDWTEKNWLPCSASEVECRLPGDLSYDNFEYLALLKATMDEGFRRGGISADVTIELGKTYGEDLVVARLKFAEYQKYIEVKLGNRPFDRDYLETDEKLSGPYIVSQYLGFKPDSRAFFKGRYSLFIEEDLLNDHSHGKEIVDKIARLKGSGQLDCRQTSFEYRHANSPVVFIELTFNKPPFERNSFLIDNRYYTATDLSNTFASIFKEIYQLANNLEPQPNARPKPRDTFDTAIHSIDGKIYVAMAKPYEQVALHFKAIHGLDYEWPKAGLGAPVPSGLTLNNYYYSFSIDSIPDEIRPTVRAALFKALYEVSVDIDAGGDGMIGLHDPTRRSI